MRTEAGLPGAREHAAGEAGARDRPRSDQDRRERRVQQPVEAAGARDTARDGDLREDRAERRRDGVDDPRADQAQREQPGGEYDRAADVGRARDLPALARALAVLACRFLCAVLGVHIARRRAALPVRCRRSSCSWPEIQPPMNGMHARDDEQPDDDLRREADREHVQLRHDARDDPERDVGDQQRDQDRRGDLDGRGEDRREDALGRPDERRQPRRGRQRHELERAVEAAQQPCFAADHEEDRRRRAARRPA